MPWNKRTENGIAMEHEMSRSGSVESRFLQSCDAPLPDVDAGPVVLVVFGATEDLSKRMLLPTLFNLYRAEKFADGSQILAVGRQELSGEEYRGRVREALDEFAVEEFDASQAEAFCKRVSYLQMDFKSDESYKELCRLTEKISPDSQTASVVYYLAVPPGLVQPIIERLFARGLCTRTTEPKIIIEKPFGSDKASASVLNEFILKHFNDGPEHTFLSVRQQYLRAFVEPALYRPCPDYRCRGYGY